MRVSGRLARSGRIALVALMAAYGALLRLDAISARYDPVSSPQWLHHLEEARRGPSVLRPAAMFWQPFPRFEHRDGHPTQYRSDPYTYLEYARQMRSFYAAHRREPVFPFATKVWLRLVDGHDTAVSFASASCAVAALVLTVLVGAEAFSFPVGVAAAALWAIEFDAVSWSTEGWRDDAFGAAVLLTTWLALRYRRQPSAWQAVAMGAAGGLTCLVRITSLSFLLPLFAALVVAAGREWRTGLRRIALAFAVALLVAGPFAYNCWRVFGDPLYSIDTHANAYRAEEGKNEAEPATVRSYVAEHLRARPIDALDTVALGMTVYPFANKWTGFDPWSRRLGPCLAAAALAGLLLFTVLPQGRWLLLVLVASMAPFSFTWRLSGDWRFTQPAYPFLLLAACAVPWAVVTAVRSRQALRRDPRLRGAIGLAAGVVLFAAGAWYALTRVTPALLFKEALRAGEPAIVVAGSRDAAFVGADWPGLTASGALTTRVTPAQRATILLPLPRAWDYDVLLRIDPSTEPVHAGVVPQRIDLTFNGAYVAACDPGSSPERIGICRLQLPAQNVRAGINRLTVSTPQPSGFRLAYIRVTRTPAEAAVAR
jgi:hypothetical protein